MSWLTNILSLKKSPTVDTTTVRRGWSNQGNIPVNEDNAMQASPFYRGVMYISTQVAKLPWKIKSVDNKVIDNRISYLLDVAPNIEMDAMSFRLKMIQDAIIYGNAFAEIERNTLGQPVAIWPMDPKGVELWRDPNGGLVYKVLNTSTYSNQEAVYLSYKDVFHLKNFHTKDGLVGQGVVAYAMEVLGISLGADIMARSLFSNGGLPSGTIEIKGTLSPESIDRLKKSWKEAQGGRKAGGIAVFEEGMKFTPITWDPEVLQFLETRQFNVLEIARFLGLPPTKLYDTKAATFSNQEQSNLEVATDTLDSWCRILEMQADLKLLGGRYAGNRTELDLYQVFRGDMTTRANYFSKMMQVAAITPNEIRMKEGMSPYIEGDRFFVAINNYSPADRIDEIIDNQMSKGNSSDPKPVDPTPDQTVNALSDEEKRLLQAAEQYLTKR